jgi:hypothetical protein
VNRRSGGAIQTLENLAVYQQILRTAERIKTLRREIDDIIISREVYERLDDFIIIEGISRIEGIEGESFAEISVVDDENGAASVGRNWNLPRLCRSFRRNKIDTKPEPQPPTTWAIYKLHPRHVWFGEN